MFVVRTCLTFRFLSGWRLRSVIQSLRDADIGVSETSELFGSIAELQAYDAVICRCESFRTKYDYLIL